MLLSICQLGPQVEDLLIQRRDFSLVLLTIGRHCVAVGAISAAGVVAADLMKVGSPAATSILVLIFARDTPEVLTVLPQIAD